MRNSKKGNSVLASYSKVDSFKATDVYRTFWKFAAERQEIFFRKLNNQPPPWTDDPILREFKFTNAYRASDRVSQYLIRNVIYRGDQDRIEVFFRTVLFKVFNRIDTWELLESNLDEVSHRAYSYRKYNKILTDAIKRKRKIFSGAYIMPSGSGKFKDKRKHRSYLKLLNLMVNERVPERISDSKSLQDCFYILRSYPMIGDFLAYQLTIDLNYSDMMDFQESDFVVPGPGSLDGIRKCFESLGGLNESDLIKHITEIQFEEFKRFEVDFKTLWGRPLKLIDCQNLFCEISKYARLAHPEITGTTSRTRIKQKYRPNFFPIDYWFPPKWGLNQHIKK